MPTPIENRVLILPEVKEKIGTFYEPDSHKSKPVRGQVIAVGAGKPNEQGTLDPMTCKVGDTVVYSQFGGTMVELDGVTHVVMRESDVLMVL